MLSSDPADGDVDVERVLELRVQLDRYLLPRSVNRGNVRVESGATTEFVSLRFDPIEREIIATVSEREPLQAHTRYDLVLEMLTDLDRQAQPEPFRISFMTGSALGAASPDVVVSWSDVRDLFSTRCALGGCHVPPEPRAGLDLSSGAAVRRTALSVPARQVPAGSLGEPSPGVATLSGLPIVDRVAGSGIPARSYLLYKVLGEPHIAGSPMPPDGPALDDAELRLLSDWILAGAPTD